MSLFIVWFKYCFEIIILIYLTIVSKKRIYLIDIFVLSHIVVSEQDILDMISTLDANKAVWPDIISNKILIAVKVQILKTLCMLFNKSLHQNIFPTDWKLANVIPLFKAGDTSFPSNYRSVSLLSCVSKLKKNVFRHIFNHVQENKLLCKFQSDFLPGCSTTHQLV